VLAADRVVADQAEGVQAEVQEDPAAEVLAGVQADLVVVVAEVVVAVGALEGQAVAPEAEVRAEPVAVAAGDLGAAAVALVVEVRAGPVAAVGAREGQAVAPVAEVQAEPVVLAEHRAEAAALRPKDLLTRL